MLRQAENEIVKLFRDSPLARYLRHVGPMPELSEIDLVKTFALQAPAIYVDSAPFTLTDGLAELKFDLLLLARHARALPVGKQGDGQALALHDLVDAALSVIDGRSTGSFSWRAASVDFSRGRAFVDAGILPASIVLQTRCYVDPAFDESSLAEFETFAAGYDIEPFESAAEHDKWLKEPPDYGASQPDLSDQLKLRDKP
jgi:hypothetical protein